MSFDLHLLLLSFVPLFFEIDFIGVEGHYVNGRGDEGFKGSSSHANRAARISGLYS